MSDTDDNKTYLGDGVYASFDGYQVWIWTSNGRIALEPETLQSLVEFNARQREVKTNG